MDSRWNNEKWALLFQKEKTNRNPEKQTVKVKLEHTETWELTLNIKKLKVKVTQQNQQDHNKTL